MEIEYKRIESEAAEPKNNANESSPRSGIFISRKKKGAQVIAIGIELNIGGEHLTLGDLEIVIEDPGKPSPTGGGRETVLPGITVSLGESGRPGQ